MSERLTDDEIAEIRRGATAHDRTWPYRAIRALLAEIDALRAERDAWERAARSNSDRWLTAVKRPGEVLESGFRFRPARTVPEARLSADARRRVIEKMDSVDEARLRAALRGESAPNPQPAPCATCGGRGEVCRLCGPMPRGAACLDHHYEEGVPCPSCSVSPGSETP